MLFYHMIRTCNGYLCEGPKYDSKDGTDFSTSFLTSARRGSEIFWELLVEKDKNPEKTKLDKIIDLVNFVLFAAIPENQSDLKFANLAFNIHVNSTITNQLKTFFESRSGKELGQLFQNSDEGWFSIHLREKLGDKYRNYWLGLDSFKSFGINVTADDVVNIRPHNYSGGTPNNLQQHENEVDLTLDDLITAYLMLNEKNKTQDLEFSATLMGIIFSPQKSEETEQLLFNKGNELITTLQKTGLPYLQDYLATLLSNYKNSHERAKLTSLTIDPSEEQLDASLHQYTIALNITKKDREEILKHAQNGAMLFKALLDGTQNDTYDKNDVDFERYATNILDLNIFLYILGIYLRDDGIGSAAFVTGIVGTKPISAYLYDYLNYIKNQCKLDVGTINDTKAKNPYAYKRQQSHGFTDAFGIDTRYIPTENMFEEKPNFDSLQPSQPLILPTYWQPNAKDARATGPQFHLLIGGDPNVQEKLFIKWETFGLWGEDFWEHAKDFVRSKAAKSKFMRNRFGLVSDDAPQYNKERVPADLVEVVKKYIKNDKDITEKAKNSISELYEYCITLGGKGLKLKEYLEKTYDHPDLRKGREIIIAPLRDDSCVWIEYFTTKDDKIKKLYSDFSLIKHQILDLATGRAVKPIELTESLIEIEKIDFSTVTKMAEQFDKDLKKLKDSLPQNVASYLEIMNVTFKEVMKLGENGQAKFIEQNARIMFDTKFSDVIAKHLKDLKEQK